MNAFWSVTMYDGKTQLLIENPINRYLINSPMLPNMKKNADGSLTLYIQKDSPGADKESNWLPAPNGPIYLVMRLYWPKTRRRPRSCRRRRHLEAAGHRAGEVMQNNVPGVFWRVVRRQARKTDHQASPAGEDGCGGRPLQTKDSGGYQRGAVISPCGSQSYPTPARQGEGQI